MPIFFGEKIRLARNAAGLTQKQLAEKLDVKNTTISNWEKNISRPDPDDIEHLCWVLGIEPNDLFSIDTARENKKVPTQKGEHDGSEIIFALSRGGEQEITTEMFEEVKQFAAFVAQREENKK